MQGSFIVKIIFTILLFSVVTSAKCATLLQINPNLMGITQQQAEDIAVEAYIYAFPLVLMEITKNVMTNVDSPQLNKAPINQFCNMREFPNADFTSVVRPNADTLYSSLWYDVSKEPLIIEVPDTNNRYYLLPMLDMWTDVFASPGSRTTGTLKQTIALVAENWQGNLPKNVITIRAPTPNGWIIGRIQTNGKDDYENVWKIQDQIKAVPLRAYGKKYVAPKAKLNPQQSQQAPIEQVNNLTGLDFFKLFCEITKTNKPHANDYPIIELISRIGIVPGKTLQVTDASIINALNAAPKLAVARVLSLMQKRGVYANGWRTNLVSIGTYGTDYLGRAGIAYMGLGANTPEDAVYPLALTDANGIQYSSENKYIIHMQKDELPPVNAFWSLTMYNDKQFFAANPLNRYTLGDRSDLQFNPDGSLDLYIQKESPGVDKQSNWLPCPATGDFTMNLRLYWPKASVLEQNWQPPIVLKQN